MRDRDIFIISQSLSALGNYFPMALALLSKNLELIGQIAIFQSLFTIFISITRSGMGFAMLKASGNHTNFQSLKPALLIQSFFILPSALIFCKYSLNSDYSLLILFSSIILFGIAQEYYRAKLISSNNYTQLFVADLIWLAANFIFAVIYWDDFSLISISVTAFFGPFSSFVYIFFFLPSFKATRPRLEVKSLPIAELIFLSAMPLITFVSIFVLNIIWSTKHGLHDLGIVRGLSLFFIPVQFVLSIFPHIILKEKNSQVEFFDKKRRLILLILCAIFALIWAKYTEIFSIQILLIVFTIMFSMYSVIVSQETALIRISENRFKVVVFVRFFWGGLLVFLGCIWPASNSTPLHLALIIALCDFFYKLILNSRFLKFG